MKRSTALVKQRWGEGISGNVIVSAWTILLMIPLLVVFVIGIAATRHAPAEHGGSLCSRSRPQCSSR